MAQLTNIKSADDWVKITSDDNYTFLVRQEIAMGSGTLRNMLSEEGGFVESQEGTCKVSERAVVVEKIMEYLMYKKLYEDAGPREEIPDFKERIIPEVALELLTAADYLDT